MHCKHVSTYNEMQKKVKQPQQWTVYMFGFHGLHMQFISFEWLKRCWEIDEMRRTRIDDDDDSAQVVRTMKNHNYFLQK